MARFKNGINGGFSGKIGSLVGIESNGKQYGRSLPTKSKKPATQAQELQRQKFRLIRAWLMPLLELINIGYRLVTGAKTPMNAAISYHLKEAVAEQKGGLVVDFSKVVLSRGELIVSWVLEVLCLADRLLHIKWTSGFENAFCKATDRASFVVYNPSKDQFATFEAAALRSDGEVSLQLPQGFENDMVHTWMHYVDEPGDRVSTSVYLGKMVVV